MADPRFYEYRGPLTIEEIVRLSSCEAPPSVQLAEVVRDVASLDAASAEHLSYCERPTYRAALANTQARAVFVSAALRPAVPDGTIALVTRMPQFAFCLVASALYPDAANMIVGDRGQLSAISKSARLGPDACVMPGAFIGP
ncbi:MAG TPA: hypothetical protein DCL48_03585, partial [Alphaproteobacteria bacterium]|nr:hypothetical protein [Alphaproteobacteria bacterium]